MSEFRRGRGRPRLFENEQVFQAIARIMLDTGLATVTLDGVAEIVGTSNQALIHRYASKAGLLNAFMLWLLVIVNEDIAENLERASSPIAAIRLLLQMPMNQRVVPGMLPNSQESWLPLYHEILRDPMLAALLSTHVREFLATLSNIVAQAIEVGEFVAGLDAQRVVETLLSTTTGATFRWRLDPRGTILDAISETLDEVLRLYIRNDCQQSDEAG
jgi:AcrR family transcriptional regulator